MVDIPIFQSLRGKKVPFIGCLLASLMVETLVARPIFIFVAKYGQGHLMDRYLSQTALSLLFIFLTTPVVAGMNWLMFPKRESIA